MFNTLAGMNQVTCSLTLALCSRAHVDLQHFNLKHRFECTICPKYFNTESLMIQVRPFTVVLRVASAC